MALVTEWKSPTAWGLLKADWTDPQNVRASDNLYANAMAVDPLYLRSHGFTGFEFSSSDIPAASLVKGFEFKQEAKRGAIVDTIVSRFRMIKAGALYGDWSEFLTWTLAVDRTQYLGGDGILLGGIWMDTDIVGVPLFGFVCEVNLSVDLSVLRTDWLQMRIWHDLPPVSKEGYKKVVFVEDSDGTVAFQEKSLTLGSRDFDEPVRLIE